MSLIKQIHVQWNGLPTGPGVSTFYSLDSSDVITPQLRTFFAALATSLPGAISLTFPATGNIIESDTGNVSGTWAASAPSTVTCSGGSVYAAAAGGVVNWHSGIYAGGREIKGKTFLVPLAPVCFDGSGQVAAATRTAIQNAAATLLSSSPSMRLFSRRTNTIASVASGSVSPTVAVLNSRKR